VKQQRTIIMTLLRSIIVLFALLSQAVPAQAMLRVSEAPPCQMSCCASLALAEMSVCGCGTASVPTEPTQAPPASGRELLPQVVWSVAHELGIGLRVTTPDQAGTGRFLEGAPAAQPHVRLAVLFCSFLN
jgi:hypothetical protein